MSVASAIQGTWTYAADPTGELPDDPVYAGSVVHFGEDGTYRFTMGRITLTGRYEVIDSGERVQTRVTLDNGEQMDVAVVRRDDGIVVYEGDGSLPGRLYVPQP